jgi:pre-mRNA-splicing factor ATP-dependent RNA helicase DHX38/PRP16
MVFQDENYKIEQLQVDRDWYNQDETGAVDETQNAFSGSDELWRQKEESFKKEQQKRISAKHMQKLRDTDLWETNRMLTSGVAQRDQVDLDFEDDEDVG